MNIDQIFQYARNIEKEKNVEIVYLSEYGSKLYGTSSENSDIDIKGIFLPNIKDCLRGSISKNIQFKTQKDSVKNTKEDVDISLWSLQYFLNLVSQGDTGAIDLLYSMYREDTILFKNEDIINPLKENPFKLFDPKNTKAYIGYAIGQAKKYGIKGSRMGVIKEIYNFLKFNNFNKDDKLETILEKIMYNFYDSSFCFIKQINNLQALVVCGKIHLSNIKIEEFEKRITEHYETYGERSKLAMQNEGIDRKAISHAVRCLCQIKELLTIGKIIYPLTEVKLVKEIKYGNHEWEYLENIILQGLQDVEELLKVTKITGKTDINFIDNHLYKIYIRR